MTPDRPILPGPLQVLARDGDDVIVGTTSAYYSPGHRYDPMTFRVRSEGSGAYSIHTLTGTLDVTVELSEDDPQLAVDLIEVCRLVLDPHPERVLALRLLPQRDASDA
jgi:hypothetical protein